MYTSHSAWYPILGQEAKLLADAKKYVNARQAQGQKCAPFIPALTSGSTIELSFRYQDLAELEAAQEANARNADWQANMAVANAASRAPSRWQLWDEVIPPAPGSDLKYAETTRFYPKQGHEGRVFALLSEGVKSEQAKRSIGLSIDMLDPDGRTIIVIEGWPSLAAFGAQRRALAGDKVLSDIGAELDEHCARPMSASLHRVVVTYPS